MEDKFDYYCFYSSIRIKINKCLNQLLFKHSIKIAFVLLTFTLKSYAHQEPQFTMYWQYYSLNNPAASGLLYKTNALVFGRAQWVGFLGAPLTAGFVYDQKIEKINSAIGLNYFADKTGNESMHKVNLNYAYQLNLKNERVLSFGVATNYIRRTIDFSQYRYIRYDPSIPTGIVSKHLLDFNTGIIYKSPKFLIGVGATNLLKSGAKDRIFQNSRHFYFNTAYTIGFSDNFSVQPSVYIKSANGSTQFDFNLLATFKKNFWTGITYRTQDAVALIVGYDFKGKFRLGYSYDYTISNIKNYSKGSHEIVMGYILR